MATCLQATVTASAINGYVSTTCAVSVSEVPVTPTPIPAPIPPEPVPSEPLTLNSTSANLYERKDKKNRDQLILTANLPVTWNSSNNKVAIVDLNTGVVTALKAGNAVITATSADGQKAECKVTVKKNNKKITKLSVKKRKLTLKKGTKANVTLVFKPATVYNNVVKWSTSDKKIATVKNGVITAKKKGKCVITVKATDGSNKKATIKVTVK